MFDSLHMVEGGRVVARDAKVSSQIYKTTNYKQFKYFKENREVKLSHVNHLLNSLKTKNLLKYLPLLVDKNMRLIDGQHRLEAAKLLKIPVYYIILDDSEIDDLWLLNSNVKGWNSENFLNFYVRRGKPDYIVLKDFCEKYGLSVYLATNILVLTPKGQVARSLNREFKEGKLKVVDLPFSRMVAEKLVLLKPYCEDDCWKDRAFAIALSKLVNKPELDVIIKKLENQRYKMKITRQANAKFFLREFEQILNAGIQKESSYLRLF